jgi:hypothetical protein
MVQRQGTDYTKWPRLNNVPRTKNNEPIVEGAPDDSDATVSMSTSSSSSCGSNDENQDQSPTVAAAAGTTPPAAVGVPDVVSIQAVPVTPAASANPDLSTTAISHRNGSSIDKDSEHPPPAAQSDMAARMQMQARRAPSADNASNNLAGNTCAGTASMDKKIEEIELKRKEMQYKMELLRNYREMKTDHGMTKQQIAEMLPDMVQYFSDKEDY